MEPKTLAAVKFSVSDALRSLLGRVAGISRSRVWRKGRRLRVCETLSLGNRGYLAVVSYRQQEFLVGGTANSIALLAQLSIEPPGGQEAREDDEPAR